MMKRIVVILFTLMSAVFTAHAVRNSNLAQRIKVILKDIDCVAGTKGLIGHKTGTGDRNMRGEIIGVNDVGFIVLPDGRHYSVAIFLKDVKGDLKEAESCIARISKVVFDYVGG